MKAFLITALALVLFTSCSEFREKKRITTQQVDLLQDSVRQIIPSVRAINIIQTADNTAVRVSVGDPSLYRESQAKKEEVALRVGLMICHVLANDNDLDSGTFAVTNDIKTDSPVHHDDINIDMKIDSLKHTLTKE
ncbi:MAG: hypothetical protein V4649_07840 [Bacteroidota bacterium]